MPHAPARLSVTDRIAWLEYEIRERENQIEDIQTELEELESELVELERIENGEFDEEAKAPTDWCGACGLSFHLVQRSAIDPVTCEDCREKDLLGIGRKVCEVGVT